MEAAHVRKHSGLGDLVRTNSGTSSASETVTTKEEAFPREWSGGSEKLFGSLDLPVYVGTCCVVNRFR